MEIINTVSTRVESAFGASVRILETASTLNVDNSSVEDGSEVTRDAFLLTEALRTAQQTPDVRADKISTLKARIAAGEYFIDDNILARNLVAEDSALFTF